MGDLTRKRGVTTSGVLGPPEFLGCAWGYNRYRGCWRRTGACHFKSIFLSASQRQYSRSQTYTERVKPLAFILVLVLGRFGGATIAPSLSPKVETTTVCNVVNHPADFLGKTVEIRAQIWADYRHPSFFWMNESASQDDKVCRFLHATFAHATDLTGQTAFGTFRGTIVKKQSRQASVLFGSKPKGLGIIFVVDQSADIRQRRDYLNGPIPLLRIYDQETGTFVSPED
jgi:hypothetical protein